MGYINSQIIVGRLGRDPVLQNEEGTLVARFPVGTTTLYRKGGETIRETEWHQVAVYGEKATSVAKALKKGGEVYVKGPKRTMSYSTSTNVPRIRVEIQAEAIKWPGMGSKTANQLPANIVLGEPPEGFEKSTAEIQTGVRIENLGPGVITPAGGVARSSAPGARADGSLNLLDDEDDFIAGFINAEVDELAELEDLSARIGTGQDTFWGKHLGHAGSDEVPSEFQESM